jgi:hypothetical protein
LKTCYDGAKPDRTGNHRHGETFRRTILALVREHIPDFGPTLASEKLAARHGLRVGVETLRQWMIADGLWVDRRHRLPSPHQPRRRRDCLGELVQIDGSEHAWFEDRGPMCTLLAFVDDATSRLMALRFVTSESAFDYRHHDVQSIDFAEERSALFQLCPLMRTSRAFRYFRPASVNYSAPGIPEGQD